VTQHFLIRPIAAIFESFDGRARRGDRMLTVVTLAVAAILGSCAGQVRRAEPVLPFHVALIPIQSDATSVAPADGADQDAHDGLKLSIDPPTLTAQLRAALETNCFARVTLLDPPPASESDEFASWTPEKRKAYWLAASANAGADLLLESELRATPELHGNVNNKFWLNLPLFLVGGPCCYFMGDNSYSGEARLDAWLYDLRPSAASHAALADGRSELTHVQARFRGTDLDFIDRAGGNIGSYAASIIVPAGLLARSSENVEHCVADRAVEELSQGLMRELRGESEHVLLGERVSSFHVAPESTLTRQAGSLHFHGAVLLRTGEIQRMDTWRLEAGGESIEGEFGDAVIDGELTTARSRYLRYALDIHLSSAIGAHEAKLTLVGGGRDVSVRTFTFEVAGERDDAHSLAQAR
jgi:hypothetical protein